MLKAIVDWWRQPPARQRLVNAISPTEWRTTHQISEIAKVSLGWHYRTLMKLEQDGIVESKWQDGPYPRRRLYRAVGEKVAR